MTTEKKHDPPHGQPLPMLHINDKPYPATAEMMTGAQIKDLAGYGANFDLLLLKEAGGNKSRPIADGDDVTIVQGMHFHALEKDRNPGNTVHADHLAAAEELRALGFKVEVLVEGDMIGFVVRDYPVKGEGYSTSTTDLLLRFPADPSGASDMFWTSPSLTLAGGGIPDCADKVQHYHGQAWRRFSWHRNTPWKPGRDTPVTYLAFVDSRLARGR